MKYKIIVDGELATVCDTKAQALRAADQFSQPLVKIEIVEAQEEDE